MGQGREGVGCQDRLTIGVCLASFTSGLAHTLQCSFSLLRGGVSIEFSAPFRKVHDRHRCILSRGGIGRAIAQIDLGSTDGPAEAERYGVFDPRFEIPVRQD